MPPDGIRLFEEVGIEVRNWKKFPREEFEGVETRERMITDEDWRPKFSTTGQCILIHGDRRH